MDREVTRLGIAEMQIRDLFAQLEDTGIGVDLTSCCCKEEIVLTHKDEPTRQFSEVFDAVKKKWVWRK